MDATTLAAIALALSAALYIFVHIAFALSLRDDDERGGSLPSVSILKPVAGADDELRENLESFAALDYPDYELLIGIADRDDPAAIVVRLFLAAHPTLRARLIWTDPSRATNPKVAQLIDLTRQASGQVVVVSDANVRVRPSYLRATVARLMRPGVGLVSNVVHGAGERTLGATVENAQLAAIAPIVVASSVVFKRAITIGKSMAMRRTALEGIGGWQSVADVLAEDDVLGQRFRRAGHRVEVSTHAVENRNVTCSIRRSMDRHTRWAKMRRTIEPACFALEPIVSPIAVATAGFAAAPSRDAAIALSLSYLLQLAGTAYVHRRLAPGCEGAFNRIAIEPFRAYIAFCCWLRGWMSRRVSWRGHVFELRAGSRLVPQAASRGARLSAFLRPSR